MSESCPPTLYVYGELFFNILYSYIVSVSYNNKPIPGFSTTARDAGRVLLSSKIQVLLYYPRINDRVIALAEYSAIVTAQCTLPVSIAVQQISRGHLERPLPPPSRPLWSWSPCFTHRIGYRAGAPHFELLISSLPNKIGYKRRISVIQLSLASKPRNDISTHNFCRIHFENYMVFMNACANRKMDQVQ